MIIIIGVNMIILIKNDDNSDNHNIIFLIKPEISKLNIIDILFESLVLSFIVINAADTNSERYKNKKTYLLFAFALTFIIMSNTGCKFDVPDNTSAVKEQAHTERNQQNLNQIQPPPTITWSLERDNLIKRFKLQNDRAVMFYMYVFIEGVAQPIGYYQVNKVSSVNSQLTNTMQIISGMRGGNDLPSGQVAIVPSPAEDGSYDYEY